MTTILALPLYLLGAWSLWTLLPKAAEDLYEPTGEIKKLDEMLRDELN